MDTWNPLLAARVAALFSSGLSAAGRDPTTAELEAAIRQSVRRCGGIRGCYAEMAAAYGDYPSTAATRSRWARRVVASAYATRTVPPRYVPARRTAERPLQAAISVA